MKQEAKKALLTTVQRVAKTSSGQGRFPYCPVIFHQPKRPEKRSE